MALTAVAQHSGLINLPNPINLINNFNVEEKSDSLKVDVVVLGNDLETLIAAIAAKDNGANSVVIVTRDPTKSLSNLITNANQTYLDYDRHSFPRDNTIFREIITKAGLGEDQVSISQTGLKDLISGLLEEKKIQVLYSPSIGLSLESELFGNRKSIQSLNLEKNDKNPYRSLKASVFLDTSTDGLLFELTGAKQIPGTLNSENKILSVSLIPSIKVSYEELDELDFQLRNQKYPRGNSRMLTFIGDTIAKDFINHLRKSDPDFARKMRLSNDEMSDGTYIGAFNLSSPDSSNYINFNGFLFDHNAEEALAFARGEGPTEDQKLMIKKFVEYLSEKPGRDVEYKLPKSLYVRDIGKQYLTTNTLELNELINSEIRDNSVASFIYPNDMRGTKNPELELLFTRPGLNKPGKAEIHLDADIGESSNTLRLYGISLSKGSSQETKGAWRIQQNLGTAAEIIGMRAGIASKQNIYPHKVNNKLIVRRFQSKGIEAREIVPPYQQTNNFDKDGFDIVGPKFGVITNTSELDHLDHRRQTEQQYLELKYLLKANPNLKAPVISTKQSKHIINNNHLENSEQIILVSHFQGFKVRNLENGDEFPYKDSYTDRMHQAELKRLQFSLEQIFTKNSNAKVKILAGQGDSISTTGSMKLQKEYIKT